MKGGVFLKAQPIHPSSLPANGEMQIMLYYVQPLLTVNRHPIDMDSPDVLIFVILRKHFVSFQFCYKPRFSLRILSITEVLKIYHEEASQKGKTDFVCTFFHADFTRSSKEDFVRKLKESPHFYGALGFLFLNKNF